MFDGQTPPTAAEIAASVRRTAKHQAAECRLAELKARAEELHVEIRRLVAERHGAPSPAESERALSRLFAEREQLSEQIATARREAVEMRRAHAAKVRVAVRPTIAAAADRARQALAELRTALATLGEIDAALIAVRDRGLDLPTPDLSGLAARLAVLAED